MKKITFVFVMMLLVQIINAQTRVITGTVTDEKDGSTLPGVSVRVKGTTFGAVSDMDGKYEVKLPDGATELLFSFVGMKDKSVVIGASNEINVSLASDSEELDEVIVVAYGTAKKESFTGSAGVVGAEKLEERTVTSVTQALDGATTGVQVTSGSGQPGEAPKIRIRGYGTLNGVADPLYIVDGIQYDGSIANINPDDIKTMTILKDASSTALYGARAANGVVMITTKNGRADDGKIAFEFKAVTGIVSQAIPYYETVGAKDYYELMYQSYKNSMIYGEGKSAEYASNKAATDVFTQLGYNPFNVDNDKIVDANGKINPEAQVIAKGLDWYDPIEQTGFRENYNLSASGGGKNHDFYVSLGYLNEKGYVVGSKYERMNGRLKFNVSPLKWMKLGTNLSVVLTEKGLASGTTGNTSYANPFYFSRNMGPIYPVYLVDPETGDYLLDASKNKQYDLGGGYTEHNINARPSGANPGRHIVAELDYNYNKTTSNNISNRTYMKFNIIKGLDFTVNYGIDINNNKSKEFENQIVGDGAPSGRFNEERYTRTIVNWNQLLNYSTTLFDDHEIELLLGHESFDRNYSEMYGMKSGLIVSGINEFDNFVTPTSLSGYMTDKKNEGYFGRFNYNYKHRYYFSGSYRRDASSVFHEDNRWGGFYSVGATWRVSEEEFMKNIEWVDQLKLRTSYGEVGNDNIGNFYAYQALYQTRPNAGASGLQWNTTGNQDLTWESINSYDAAVEFTLFGDRLHGSLEYYKKESEDLLYDMPLPLSMGLSIQPRNIATLYNEGFELGLGGTVLDMNGIKWDMEIQTSTVKNEITEIPDPFVTGSKRWAKGHSIYDYYLYDYYGVDQRTGAALYHVWEEDEKGNTSRKYDSNGAPVLTEDYTSAGRGYTGDSSIPDLFGSVSNTVSYKGFQLDLLMTYSIGGKILDYNYADLMGAGSYGNALHVDHIDGWRKVGDKTNIPRLQEGNSNLAPSLTDRWLTDASYLALRNINLSYTFGKPQLKYIGVNSLKVFASAENLFMLTARKGMNPQQEFDGTTSNVYLPSRVFSVGVSLGF